ncbi:pleckstrin homology domain-containing family A member 1-like [Oscarella lobularis]|uniref:pleckstrin homology domain-containing family A member 1-like n=1 Tax=Oscarella lobularis TaxID=121494 RepID=UPI0033130F14
MPYRDKHNRLCGQVEKESAQGSWSTRFLVLDGTILRIYRSATKDLQGEDILDEINTKYVTKVAPSAVRPKKMFCFEIALPDKTHYFEAENETEREEWIEQLKQATVPKRVNSSRSSGGEPKAEVHYQTKVVGGVVVRTPILRSGSATAFDPSDVESAERCKAESIDRKPDGMRILKAGYCVKQGAKMKNWKQRYFVLDPIHFSYYKAKMDKEPIRSVSIGDIRNVVQVIGYHNKDNLFQIETPSRTFYIQAESDEELHSWLKAFSSVVTAEKGRMGTADFSPAERIENT